MNIIHAHTGVAQGHQHEKLIRQLQACVTACNNILPEAGVIGVPADCAEICALASKLLAGASDYSHELLIICQKVCTRCAFELNAYDGVKFKEGVDECRKCAEACKAHFDNIEFNSIH